MKFMIEKKANLIFIVSDCGIIFKSWDVRGFTQRKLDNAIKKIKSECSIEAKFINML